MQLRVYRGLWGILTETDGVKAGSPYLDLDSGTRVLSNTMCSNQFPIVSNMIRSAIFFLQKL